LVAWRWASLAFRAHAQRAEDVRRHFDGTLHARAGADLHHAGPFDETVGEASVVGEIREAAPHEPLHRDDRVLRVGRLVRHRVVPHLHPVLGIAHDRRHQRTPLSVRQHLRNAIAHRGDERVGRAEVDADLALGRGRRCIRLGDLEQRHHVRAGNAGTRPDHSSK
jgi:NAD-specific glutamate dehydrogenase